MATGTGALSWQHRVRIASSVAAGLASLHQIGVVHGNLNSGNILLDDPGSTAYLSEHWISTLCGGQKNLEQIVLDHQLYNSAWCDPALAAGSLASAATDMYSLGVILLELLLGRLPAQTMRPTAPGSLYKVADRYQGTKALLKVLDTQAGPWDLNAASILHKTACQCLNPSHPGRPSSQEVAQQLSMLLRMHNKRTKQKVVALRGMSDWR
eukprot:TRINITY_DN61656_c0_g1_i1.p1 TRINITY_DN61656_c0_g1~~TRINITY_DN61656_c0_g1_i1.p1  ORF type:complete len:210 (+),score=42.31 TRINITY_DN61656_c0_g1_i1:327-956(+)